MNRKIIGIGLLAATLAAIWAAFVLFTREKVPPVQAPEAAPPAEAPATPTPQIDYKAAIEGARPGEWTMDFEAAKALAAETGLPLLLNFTGSDWCGWCRMMDKQVFSQEAWKTYAKEHFVLVWIDFPREKALVPEKFVERNTKLAQAFEVGGFPTFVLLDADGQTRLGQTGASRDATPERFIAALEEILLASDKSVAALRETMTDDQQAELDAAREAQQLARQKLDDWLRTEPEQTEENVALQQGLLEEIAHADEAVLQLLRSAVK